MTFLQVLSPDALRLLRAEVRNVEERLGVYLSGDTSALVQAGSLQATRIEIPDEPPKLVMQVAEGMRPASTDAANAILVHQYLSRLVRVAAADERVWAALTHTQFRDYVRWRWPTDTTRREDPREQVLKYWFMSGAGLAALRFNAISRLWWAAALTVAPWRSDTELQFLGSNDDYRFTRVLLSSQQVYMDIMERQYGSSNRLRICLLDALDRRRTEVRSFDALSRDVAKRLTLVLGYRHLLTRPAQEIHAACTALVDASVASVASGDEGRAAPPGEDGNGEPTAS